jgi:hypothetical protein
MPSKSPSLPSCNRLRLTLVTLLLTVLTASGCAHDLVRAGACIAGDSAGSATSSKAQGSSISPGDGAGVAVGVALMAAGAALDRGRPPATSTSRPTEAYQRRESGCQAVTSAQ